MVQLEHYTNAQVPACAVGVDAACQVVGLDFATIETAVVANLGNQGENLHAQTCCPSCFGLLIGVNEILLGQVTEAFLGGDGKYGACVDSYACKATQTKLCAQEDGEVDIFVRFGLGSFLAG